MVGTEQIGHDVRIGKGVQISCSHLDLGDYVQIGDGTVIEVAGPVRIGRCSILGPRNVVRGMAYACGEYLYTREDVEFGGGGCYSSPESTIRIGHSFFSGENSVFNCARTLVIGDEVGCGAGVGVWTHGGYLSCLHGFPSAFAPVSIGSHVWLPGQTQVLPGVRIGSNVVLGMTSLVNRNVPDGVFAGGTPARVIREAAFPLSMTQDLVDSVCRGYLPTAKWKGLDCHMRVEPLGARVNGVRFDFSTLETDTPDLDDVAEDFRDWLRQRGIRFRTGRPYKTARHPEVTRWIS